MIEHFFRTLKSECVWQEIPGPRPAFEEISRWLDRYYEERPHSAPGYLTPREYREH
jgi:putative transposase